MAGDAGGGGEGRGDGADAFAVDRAFVLDRAADPALAHLVAGGRCRQPCPLHRARRKGEARRRAGPARPARRDLGGADPDQEIRGVVGTDPGRTAADFRGQVAPYRKQPEISAGDRPPALSLPRPRRALRFPDLVRIRARACGRIRGTGRHAARDRGVEICRPRGGHTGWSANGWMRGDLLAPGCCAALALHRVRDTGITAP